jgi:hypothetical protein
VKRALVIGAAATLIWVAVANSLPAKQARAADWSRVKTIRTASGIAATYPRSWTAFARGPTTLAIASFPMPREWPDRAHKRVPDGSVYILLWSYGRAWGGYPAGTRPFELSDEYHGLLRVQFQARGIPGPLHAGRAGNAGHGCPRSRRTGERRDRAARPPRGRPAAAVALPPARGGRALLPGRDPRGDPLSLRGVGGLT